MWKSAKQALDPKALFSPDPHMQRAQSQATPAASGKRQHMAFPCIPTFYQAHGTTICKRSPRKQSSQTRSFST